MTRTYIKDTVNKVGETVLIKGWVNIRRDHGKLIFLDVRDKTGLIQVVVNPKVSEEAHKVASGVRNEYVIELEGKINPRGEKQVNTNLPTGKIELEVTRMVVLNTSEPMPLSIDTDGSELNEEVRLKYRYLDLRRDRLQKNLRLRSEFIDKIRQFLFKNQFTEIETPILSAPTPEGSRDFIVPARLQPGKFFALPQSPQQYKQLLMVAGFEKYFQIARCFRDEDLRADRGFEHTQIDIETSFLNREEIMQLDEEMFTTVMESLGYKIKQKPFPVFTYQEALEKFGADKFDLRTEEEKKTGVLAYAWVIDFPFFEKDNEGKWTFTHNPFSIPKPEFVEQHIKGENIENILTSQYDLVCNGLEVGGGSVRAHKPEILKATFKIMGYSEEQIQSQFGHMLEAFSFGAPPHGGIAHGIERNIMALLNDPYLRETQAFPQTSSGRTAVMNAPSEVTDKQLKELHIKVDLPKDKK